MKNKNKKNNWKISTIILGIIFISLLIFNIIRANENYKISKDNLTFEISKDNFNKIINNIDSYQQKRVYDLNHKTSVIITHLND